METKKNTEENSENFLENLTLEQIAELEESTNPSILEDDDLAKVVFHIKKDSNMDVEFRWGNDCEKYAKILGAFLHEINAGSYGNSIVQIMTDHAKNYPEDLKFIDDVITAWQAGSATDEEAIVSPLRTFGASRFL